jgi:amidase
MDPSFLSAARLAGLVRKGEIGCLELLDHTIARVERLDDRINAIVVRDFDRARSRAKALDRKRKQGRAEGKLFGVPMTVKESFDVAGLPTTWGIPGLEKTTATSNALAVDRLLDAGAVVFGKTNVPIYLGDWQSFNAIYGTTNNPWNLALGAGGSSGGAAAALAAGLTGLELGSDIGASIRNPAHYCGVYGHKPTWGICPPLGQSLDGNVTQPDIAVIGPMARSAEDLTLGLDAIAGPEPIDAGVQLRLPAPRLRTLKGMRVAIMPTHDLCDTDDEIQAGLARLATHLRREGAKVSLTARPDYDIALGHRLYVTLLRATTSTRMDDAMMARWQAEAARLPADDTSYYALMARGNALLHRDFLRGHEQRERMRRAWFAFFREWDVLLCPAAAGTAMPHDPHGERWERSITVNGKTQKVTDQMFWAGISCFFGLPGTVAPLGLSAAGLPFGVQIVGPQYGDRTTIGFARLLENSWRGFAAPPGWQ